MVVQPSKETKESLLENEMDLVSFFITRDCILISKEINQQQSEMTISTLKTRPTSSTTQYNQIIPSTTMIPPVLDNTLPTTNHSTTNSNRKNYKR